MARGSFEVEASSGSLTLNHRSEGTLRTLAEVGRSDDLQEQEADRVADQVLHNAGPTSISSSQEGASIRRKSETHDAGGSALVPSLGQGKPLDPADRSYFEPRFGLSLDHVRVHADPQAAASASAIHASAYTLGRDLVFGEGRYQPGTQAGRQLLAHELAHVAQQRNGTQSVIRRQPAPPGVKAEAEPTPPARKEEEHPEGDPDAGPAEEELRGTLTVKENNTALRDSAKIRYSVKKRLDGGTKVEVTHDAGNCYRVTIGAETGYILKSDLLGSITKAPKEKDTRKKDAPKKDEPPEKDAEPKPPAEVNPFQGIIDRATQTLSGGGEKFYLLDSTFGLNLLKFANDTSQKLPVGFGGDTGWGTKNLKPLFRKAGWKPGDSWHALFTLNGRYMLATLRQHPGRWVGGKFVGGTVEDGLEAASLFADWEKRLTAKKAMP
jgi:hypothetical protein